MAEREKPRSQVVDRPPVDEADAGILAAIVESAARDGIWPSRISIARKLGGATMEAMRSLELRGLVRRQGRDTYAASRDGLRSANHAYAEQLLANGCNAHSKLRSCPHIEPHVAVSISVLAGWLGMEAGRLELLLPLFFLDGGVRLVESDPRTGTPISVEVYDHVPDADTQRMWAKESELVQLTSAVELQAWYDAGARVFAGIALRQTIATKLRLVQAVLTACEFLDCDLRHLDVSEAVVSDTRFSNCQMEASRLASARLKEVEFVDCELYSADFRRASFDRVDLSASDIQGSQFSTANGFSKLSLLTAEFDAIQINGRACDRETIEDAIAERRLPKRTARKSAGMNRIESQSMLVRDDKQGRIEFHPSGSNPVVLPRLPGARALRCLMENGGRRVHFLEIYCAVQGYDWGCWADVVDRATAATRCPSLRNRLQHLEDSDSCDRLVAIVRALGASRAYEASTASHEGTREALERARGFSAELENCMFRAHLSASSAADLKSKYVNVRRLVSTAVKSKLWSSSVSVWLSKAVELGEWFKYSPATPRSSETEAH